MKIVNSVEKMQSEALRFKREGKTIGFVPTMGALHRGHLSLMDIAREFCDILVVSIYVNPTQFGPGEDLDRYPRNFKSDREKCEKHSVDIIFFPNDSQIYPEGFSTQLEVKGISEVMCGAYRPGHFAGVTKIVAILFNIVQPDYAIFGKKDYQQAAVIKRMVVDLHFPVKIVLGDTIREPDGLAMSSRNKFLNESQRKSSSALYEALKIARDKIENNPKISSSRVIDEMKEYIDSRGDFEIQYIFIGDSETLEWVESPGNRECVIALAAYMGNTRLIDNILVNR